MISEDVGALLCLPGVKVVTSGPITGMFVWGPPISKKKEINKESSMIDHMIPGLPELQL